SRGHPVHRYACELVAVQARPRRAAGTDRQGRDDRVRRLLVRVADLLGAAAGRARGVDHRAARGEPGPRLRPGPVRRAATPGGAPDAARRAAGHRRAVRVPGEDGPADPGAGARPRARLVPAARAGSGRLAPAGGPVFTRAFPYERAERYSDACDLLREHGEEATVIAGGQSLMPMINLGLVQPGLVVDISRPAGGGEPTRTADGHPVVRAPGPHPRPA